MGAAGAAIVAVAFLIVTALGLGLTLLAWRGTREAQSPALRACRYLLPVGLGVLALGLLLPKSTLRELAFETSGRVVVVLAASIGALSAGVALGRREPGAARALAAHLYFGIAAGTPVGEAIFGVFQMM